MSEEGGWLELLDWRRRVAALYADLRTAAGGYDAALLRFRAGRDDLFRHHPQSPVAPGDRADFPGLAWFDADPAWRFEADLLPRPEERLTVYSGTGEAFVLVRFGAVELPFGALDVHWIDVYGGGVFVAFTDATSGRETYGGGRYLLDTAKGADLGGDDGRLVLDFNTAYHPSCVYDPRWSCPLAPPGNRLAVPVRAGERLASRPGAD